MPERGPDERHLVLFFTYGVSLKEWKEAGLLTREVAPYRRLIEDGWNVSVLTYGTAAEERDVDVGPVNVLVKPRGLPAFLYSLLAPLIHFTALRNATHLKTNQMQGSWTAVIAKYLLRKPLVVRCGYEWKRFREQEGAHRFKLFLIGVIEAVAYRAADAIILTSSGAASYVRSTFGVPVERIHVIPNYIDTDLFRPISDVEEERGRLIFVGRLTEQKNLTNLLYALQGVDGVELIVVGDGPLREELENLSEELGLRVDFRGRVPNEDLPGILNTAEGFVLPSHHEGSPKALLEAMACGVPPIVTPVSGTSEVVTDGEEGIVCNGTRCNDIRAGINRLLKTLSSQDALGERARARVVSLCSLDSHVREESQIMREIERSVAP